MHRMSQWITTGERPTLPVYVSPFAKAASGGGSGDEDDDEDDEDDDEDDEDDDDPDAGKSDEELRAELKQTRASLKKANDQSARRRRREREARRTAEEAARKPKPKKDGDEGDGVDLDTIRGEAKAEGERAGTLRAKKAEAKASLLGAGVNPARVARAVGLLDLDDLDLDDEGLDGIDDAIEDLRKDWPELFAKKRVRRESVAGDRDRGGEGSRERGKSKSASELAAARLLGKAG